MFKLLRLEPHIKVALHLGFCAFLLNTLLQALAATSALEWLPERTTGRGFLEDARQRVTGAYDEYLNGKIASHRYLGAIVGLSDIREGINLGIFSDALGEKWQILGIAGAGAGMETVEENANVILNSTLRPDMVIVGLTPIITLDTMLARNAGQLEAGALAREFNLDWVKDKLKSVAWIYLRRKDISLATDDLLKHFHKLFLDNFGVINSVPLPSNPWRDMQKLLGAEHYPEPVLRKGLKWAESIGAFDSKTYEHSVVSQTILKTLVDRFKRKGAVVVVVLTPEHSWITSREPPDIFAYLRNTIFGPFTVEGVHFLDYRKAVSDSNFVDLVHLNSAGRDKFSRILAKDLQNMHFDRPPLMTISN